MKAETLEEIKRQAEEMYPSTGLKGKKYTSTSVQNQRDAHIEASTFWVEKLERIREEIIQERGRLFSRGFGTENEAERANVQFEQLGEVLSIIDKHLQL